MDDIDAIAPNRGKNHGKWSAHGLAVAATHAHGWALDTRVGRGPSGFDVTGFACAGGELSALGVGWRMKMPMHNDYIIP